MMQSTKNADTVNDSQGGTIRIEAATADVSERDKGSHVDAHHDCDATIAGNYVHFQNLP